jgi:hypothetical protein
MSAMVRATRLLYHRGGRHRLAANAVEPRECGCSGSAGRLLQEFPAGADVGMMQGRE